MRERGGCRHWSVMQRFVERALKTYRNSLCFAALQYHVCRVVELRGEMAIYSQLTLSPTGVLIPAAFFWSNLFPGMRSAEATRHDNHN